MYMNNLISCSSCPTSPPKKAFSTDYFYRLKTRVKDQTPTWQGRSEGEGRGLTN